MRESVKKQIGVLAITLFSCLIPPGFSTAADIDDASQYLCQYGISLYKEGNLVNAKHELLKALMVNPTNELAKKYLKLIEIKEDVIKEVTLPQQFRTSEQNDSTVLEKKNEEIAQRLENIAELKDLNRALEEQNSQLQSVSLSKDNELKRLTGDIQRQKEDFQERLSGKESLLKSQGEQITGLQEQLSDLTNNNTQQNAAMDKLTQQIEEQKNLLNKQGDSVVILKKQYESSLSEKEDRIKLLDDKIKNLDEAALNNSQKTKAQLAQLQEALDTKEAELAEAVDEKKKLVALKVELEGNLKDKETALTELKTQVDSGSLIVSDALLQNKQVLAEKGSEIQKLKKDLGASVVAEAQYKEDLDKLTRQLSQKEEEVAQLRNDSKQKAGLLSSGIAEKEKQLASKDSQVRDLKVQLEKVAKQLEETKGLYSENQKQLQEALSAKEAELAKAVEEKQKLVVQIDELKVNIKDKETVVSKLKAQVDSGSLEASDALSQKKQALAEKDSGIQKLSKDLEATKVQLLNISEEKAKLLSEKKSDTAQLMDQLVKAKASAKEKEEQLSRLCKSQEESLKQKEVESKQLRNQLQDSQAQLAGLTDKDFNIKSLENKIKQVQESSSVAEAQYKEDLDKLTRQLSQKEEEVAQLRNDSKQKAGLLSSGIAEKEKQLASKDSQVKDLNVQLEKVAKQLEETKGLYSENQKQLQEAKAQLQQVQSSLADKDSETSNLRQDLEKTSTQLTQLQAVLNTKEKELIKIKDERGAVEEKYAKLNYDVTKLQKENEDYQHQLNLFSSESVANDKENARLNQDLNSAKKFLENKNDEFGSLRTKYKALLKVNDLRTKYYNNKIKGLKQKTASQIASKYQNKLQALEDTLSARNKEFEAVKKKNEALSAEKADSAAEKDANITNLRETMEQLKKSLGAEITDYQAKLELAQRGLEVVVLTDILFNSGSIEVSPEGKLILEKISDVLADISYGNQIIIEGHTDNEPIKHSRWKWKSNWELSCARALSVLNYLTDELHLEKERFSVAGYGEYMPMSDNSNDEGKKQNRRVEIIIQPKVKKIPPEPDSFLSSLPNS